ncbi:MAG: hypothetical protein ABIJ09_26505 [Pseudomonadota bacterium]
MVTSIRNTFKQIAADGRVGKNDVQKLVASALDGAGISKTEAAELRKLREQHGDKFTPQAAKAFDAFLGRMERSWSSTKKVHLPNVKEGDVQKLLDADPRIGIYTGRSRASGGETAPRRRTSSSESSVRPAPRRSSGGESNRSSYRSSSSSSYGGSGGGYSGGER